MRPKISTLTAAVLVLALAGCSMPPVPPASLTADSGAEKYAARSLDDPGLQAYLRENLGHDATTWDFSALCWAGFYFRPSLAVARAQWAGARAAQRTAAQRPNPTLTLTPGYDTTHQAGISPWMPAINADLLLMTAGKRSRQEDIARAESEAARLGVVSAAWTMRSELRKALIDASASARRAALLQAQSGAQQRLVTLLEQRYAAGAASAVDVSTARTAALRAASAAADAAAQVISARARVAAAIGIPAAAVNGLALPVPPEGTPLSAAELASAQQRALRTRADVLIALAKYASAQAALDLEVARRLPDVHLGPGYQWDQGLNKWSLGITFELPIFNHNEGPIAEALARRAEAAAQFDVVQNQAVAEIDAAVAAQTAATTQLERAREMQSQLHQQESVAQRSRELGASDAAEVETAEIDADTATVAVTDAESALATASGELEDALQLPFANMARLTADGERAP